ncbi:glycosyl hydrolase [Enterovibrio coralii]|uniref:Glycosyl hydrolase n=1 Tax=Enterovibrio coralii TaxID=294935 RepID=A0A135I8X6_9GAMM|nr:glycosyl hydrolase [Enterovibrio coralii]
MLPILLSSQIAFSADVGDFWETPQHGGNVFNRLPASTELYSDLSAYNASWVRIAYDKWPSESRDFLLGDADDYQGLVPADLKTLKGEIQRAGDAGLKVVISPLSLPAYRWAQNNNGKFDGRLFSDKANWEKAAAFWKDLASELKDSPHVAAYNIINEPAPEKQSSLKEHASASEMKDWYEKVKGSSRDLPAFYEHIVAAIREVDSNTPIMVDAGWYAAADSFNYWEKTLSDDKVLYSFHMYEPYEVTSAPNLRRDVPLTYPGNAPFGDNQSMRWDKAQVAEYLNQPVEWAKSVGLPTNKLVAGEFGCARKVDNCAAYLMDVIAALDANQLHWAFYSFREDAWDAMNYELGTKGNVGWKYWQAMEEGKPDPTKYSSSGLFSIIQQKL